MNEILEKILEELQFHTKLLEGIFGHLDQKRHDSQSAKIDLSSHLNDLKKMIIQHQAIKDNPELAAIINNALSPLIKGGVQ